MIYILVCLNWTIFKESIGGQNQGGQKGQKEVNQLKIKKITYICIFCYRQPGNTPDLAKYRFRSIFYFLVCLPRAFFKESIGSQTWGSKNLKKRSINSNLENLPMDAILLQIPI